MINSGHLEIPMEANDSNWKEPCYTRLLELRNTSFGSPAYHWQYRKIRNIKDTMNPELYNAVRDKNIEVNKFLDVLEEVCRKNPRGCQVILNEATPTGDSLLHVAAEFGREKIAELLVDHNVSLHATNITRDTPLHVAARHKNIGVMKVILSKFKDAHDKAEFIMSPNIVGKTALHEAVLRKYHEGFDFLLREQSESTLPRYWNADPALICLAVEIGDVEIVRRLLQIPFPSEEAIKFNRTSLLRADIPKFNRTSPLHVVIPKRNTALLQEMVDKREELMYLTDFPRNTPLHYAASTGYVEGVRILLKKSNLLAFQRNSDYNLPIHLACERGHVQVVKELLGVEWPLTRFWLNEKGQSILHIAAMNGQNKVVKYLLRNSKIHHEIVNERDKNGNTPLHLASTNLCLWTLLLLSRDKKIDVNLLNFQNLTARDIVQMQSKVPMTRQEFLADVILERAGASISEYVLGLPRVANKEWNVKDAASTLIVVATLIATVTFAAGFTVPGGLYSSDSPVPKERGMVVLVDQILFRIFMAFNTIAMYSSTLGSVILLWVPLGDRHFAGGVYGVAKFFVYAALIAMPVAFLAAIRLVVSNNTLLADVITVIGSIFIFLILFARILGRFPLGTRLPLLRQLGYLFIWIILILFYGRNDILIDEVGEVNNPKDQDDKANNVNHVNSVGERKQISELNRVHHPRGLVVRIPKRFSHQ